MKTSLVWYTLYWAWVVSEVLVLLVTRTRADKGDVRDRGSLLILWPVIAASLTLGSWFGEAHAPTIFAGAHWVRLVSVGVLAVGIGIRWTAILTLGRSFSVNVAIRATQTVHRSGVFRVVRHPSYSGLLLILAAIGLHTRSWIGLAIITIFPAMALLYRIHVEEAALRDAFGSEYESYSRTTRRLVPGLY
ncbi:MAG: isoprenylcysteine carboxylmethyltransferase family protein [Acidobacteriota bacterium]|nr:isoprenylcysteine carboxylmethyltransferase family protein [Acidobacteriota bacterium]